MPTFPVTMIAVRATQLVGECVAQAGVSKTTFGFLAALDEFGASSQAEIGRRLGVDRKNLSEEAVALEERGFIRRHPDPQDVRRNRMEITPAGQALLNELNDSFWKIQDRIFACLSTEERAKLHETLLRVIDAGAQVTSV